MADKLRVHTLSKELGVTSKAILAKCKEEGVEGVTNHMSTLSAGLAETIREWFSEESHGTAVETAAPVDLEKVRAKRRPRKRKQEEEQTASEPKTAEAPAETPDEEAVEVTESPVETTEAPPALAAEVPPEITVEGIAPTEEPVAESSVELVAEEAAPAVAEVAPQEVLAAEATMPQAEGRVEGVRPAGPQNVPAPAQMKGPRIVGYAKPDVVDRPVPRARPASTSGGESTETRGPAPRRGARGRAGTAEEEGAKLRARVNPRRSRGSIAEVGERLREWNERDLLERQERLLDATGRGIHARRAREKGIRQPVQIPGRKTTAQVTEPILVHELCAATGIGQNQLIPKLMRDHGLMVGRNTVIPNEVAEALMADFGVELEVVKPKTELEKLKERYLALPRNHLQVRPPVVTILGHVDHGKTSLLDRIRQTSVAAGEAGGITQHIGAYRVERGDLSVTFLDTPGHEAFTSMRARGANMTDVVVLVVAADDGLMPQTIEAINHAKAAKVPIVVALNKIDLPGVDTNKIYGQLAEMELAPTEWGGQTDVIKTSAVTGQGVEDLVTHLATLSDLLEIKADSTLPARGAVVEAQMKPAVGAVARLLVQEGTLKRGDFLVCGPAAGRVRMLRDDRGRAIKQAGPGFPVEVAGLDAVPNAGDPFYCVESLQKAKDVATEVAAIRRQEQLVQFTKAQTLDDLFSQRESGRIPELNLILRADVQGSLDALLKMLGDIPSQEVKLNILHTGIGAVTESDIMLAAASKAMVVGFNVSSDASVQRLADTERVDLRSYRVIYELGDDIRKSLEGLLPTIQTEEFRGRAQVRESFRVSRVGNVAGCIVADGVITRSNKVRVIRDGKIVIPTEEDVRRKRHRAITSLRRFKDDAREVRAGMECGLRVEDFDDVKPGDVIEAYEVIETMRTLS